MLGILFTVVGNSLVATRYLVSSFGGTSDPFDGSVSSDTVVVGRRFAGRSGPRHNKKEDTKEWVNIIYLYVHCSQGCHFLSRRFAETQTTHKTERFANLLVLHNDENTCLAGERSWMRLMGLKKTNRFPICWCFSRAAPRRELQWFALPTCTIRCPQARFPLQIPSSLYDS